MTEIWKPVVGFEAYYEVSSEGRARRIAPAQNTYVGRLLKAHNRRGYRQFVFAVDNATKNASCHRTVWEAFNGPIPPGMQVNHKNGIKHDNRLENLEVVTQSENMVHARDILGWRGSAPPIGIGSKNGRAKLTEADIQVVISLRKTGLSQQKIADRLGVDQTSISRILLGKSWSTVPNRPILRSRPDKTQLRCRNQLSG